MSAASSTTSELRGAVLGLGMMGRHHARLLQSTAGVAFAGAVDPGGDVHGAVRDPGLVFASLDALLAAGPLDFAIVAAPAEEHLPLAARLIEAGVHALVEKPLAATVEESRELIRLSEGTGVRVAVGHVERCNPALLELRRRAQAGEVGDVFMIAAERQGPFPARIKDVGVVKDLGTHDLDLVRWIGGAPVLRVAAETQHRMGRAHEDLVLVTGRLRSGVAFSCSVDWLTPTKVRRVRVLGSDGMLVADQLTGDLTLYRNGDVESTWDAARTLRGVSEGDMTRFAIARREPLLVQLETFCAYVRGEDDAGVVTLEEGLHAVQAAETVLLSAREGMTVRMEDV
ncbi:Gfo/Idh/MocA family oxidoreductase [Conexibacter sp. W3-3-2]|uniref:Gfo/Idh/MocA family protein n=1 Tax=Conexibacter sp. W3-3-2 TaxID=2675227 RepID=UPI00281639B6|nr:Gfo/Idh/MocA family oxidoreductase [Conexibacter sp. W3-3-2]